VAAEEAKKRIEQNRVEAERNQALVAIQNTLKPMVAGRFEWLPTAENVAALRKAADELEKLIK